MGLPRAIATTSIHRCSHWARGGQKWEADIQSLILSDHRSRRQRYHLSISVKFQFMHCVRYICSRFLYITPSSLAFCIYIACVRYLVRIYTIDLADNNLSYKQDKQDKTSIRKSRS